MEDKSINSENDKYDVNGISVLLQAGLNYHITSKIGLQFAFGYDITSSSKVKNLPNTPNANWSGFRLNGGINYSF